MTKHPFCCHIAVTPSFLHHHSTSSSKICCHTILSPPPLHPIEQNLLSHYYHITVTLLSSEPFLLKKSTPSPKESAHSHQNYPCFLENLPYFPEKVRYFLENVPHFLKKVGHHRGKHSPWLRSPVTDVTEKNTKLLVYTRACARVEIKAIIYRVRPSSIARFSPANMEGNEVVDVRPTTNGID